MFRTTQPKIMFFFPLLNFTVFWQNALHKPLQLNTNKFNLCSLQQKQHETCKHNGICSVSSDCYFCPILVVRTAKMTPPPPSPVRVVVGGTCTTIMWDQLHQRGQDLTAAETPPGRRWLQTPIPTIVWDVYPPFAFTSRFPETRNSGRTSWCFSSKIVAAKSILVIVCFTCVFSRNHNMAIFYKSPTDSKTLEGIITLYHAIGSTVLRKWRPTFQTLKNPGTLRGPKHQTLKNAPKNLLKNPKSNWLAGGNDAQTLVPGTTSTTVRCGWGLGTCACMRAYIQTYPRT